MVSEGFLKFLLFRKNMIYFRNGVKLNELLFLFNFVKQGCVGGARLNLIFPRCTFIRESNGIFLNLNR